MQNCLDQIKDRVRIKLCVELSVGLNAALGSSALQIEMTENSHFRFILQSREEVNNLLTEKQKTVDEKIKELEV